MMVQSTKKPLRAAATATDDDGKIMTKSSPSSPFSYSYLSKSSSPAKLALFAILALAILNLNASSIILSASPSRRQHSSLRKGMTTEQRASTIATTIAGPESKATSSAARGRRREEEFDDEEYDESSVSGDADDDGKAHAEWPDVSPEAGDDADDSDAASEAEEGEEARQQIATRPKGEGVDGGEKRGKIAWLMSFPNSGTSFTSLLVRHASNATTATNYGMESNLGADGRSVPVYDWSVEGPYWLHPPRHAEAEGDATRRDDDDEKEGERGYRSGTKLGKSGTYAIPPESASILTKTHCGGRCASCPPEKYLETASSFLERCLSGSRKVVHPDGRIEKRYYPAYSPSVVERAVHLVRDPFDNLVSRFHHERKEHRKRDDTTWTGRYPDDVPGFRRWCADQDGAHAGAERDADWTRHGLPADFAGSFEGVSCHGELFRYVQWHALADRAARALGVPVLRVHYEDYSSDLAGEADRLLAFLGLGDGGGAGHAPLPRFDSDKDYSEYFTKEERAGASDFMKGAAAAMGEEDGEGADWAAELLERYWVEWDFDKMRAQTKSIK